MGNALFVAPGGEVRQSANVVEVGPQSIDNLDVTIQYRFDIATRSVRAIYLFTNPTTELITTEARINIGNFGGNAAIENTSNGSAMPRSSTRWFETAGPDDQDPNANSVLFVAYGKDWNGFQSETMIRSQSGNGANSEYVMDYALAIPAQRTIGVMVFAQVNSSPVDPPFVDNTFETLVSLSSAGLLADLPLASADILNWSKGPGEKLTFPRITLRRFPSERS